MAGGPDEELNFDRKEDPVERTESISVSRDIKGKKYTIEHSHSVNFENDFDMVTDYPLYKQPKLQQH